MNWQLSNDWGVNHDAYNWVLQHKATNRWRNVGYYPTPEVLLLSLHRKILLTNPAQPDLIQHLEVSLDVAQGCCERLSEQIHTELGSASKMTPQIACATLDWQSSCDQ